MTQTIEVRKVHPLLRDDQLVGGAKEATAKFVIKLLAPHASLFGYGLYMRIIETEND